MGTLKGGDGFAISTQYRRRSLGQGTKNGNIIVVISGLCVATRTRESDLKVYHSTNEFGISGIVRKSMRMRIIFASRI